MEFHYIYAIHCKEYACGENSPFYYHVFEYIDKFFEKSDVVADIHTYIQLF